MRKSIAVAAIVLTGTLSLSIALAERVQERALQDRLSFGDLSVSELLAE